MIIPLSDEILSVTQFQFRYKVFKESLDYVDFFVGYFDKQSLKGLDSQSDFWYYNKYFGWC